MPSAVISIAEQIETATGVNILEVLNRKNGSAAAIDADSEAIHDGIDAGQP